MSFLQSLFLLGLAGAVIPVLIHLLNRPRAQVIRFSTLEFVKRLQIRRSKRLRVREFLLLILRVLILALLALAFARPALQGSLAQGLGGTVRTSACIVLDGSYSMAFEESRMSLFELAKKRCRDVVRLLREGDESFLVIASNSPESRFERPTHNLRLLESEIDRVPQSSKGTDLALSVREANRLLQNSRNPNREIYLATDMQLAGLPALSDADWDDILDDGTRLYVLPVGEKQRSNVAVTGAELHEPRRFGEAVRIRSSVTNFSEGSAQVLVTLLIDGERRGTTSLSLDAGASEPVVFSVPLPEGGSHRGEIRIDDDRLGRDNAFYFVVDRPEKLQVLLVGARGDRSIFYLSRAIDPEQGDGLIEYEIAEPGELRSMRLGRFHSVFLAGVPSFDEPAIAALESYVRGGGGLVIIPGDALDFGAYNQVVLPRLFGGAAIGSSLLEYGNRPMGVDWYDADHPVFGLFPKGFDRALRDLAVARSLDLTFEEPVSEVIRSSDGRPFVLETRVGSGRTFLFSVGFDLPWTDLATQPIFLPMIHEMVRYLYSGGALYKQSVPVGRTYRRDLAGVGLGREFACTTPSGESIALQPISEGDGLVLEFSSTTEAGFYRLEGVDFDEWFAVNLETEESDLASLPESQFGDFFPRERATLVPSGNRLDRPVLQSRFGRELWWELVIAALVLAVIELIIAQGSRQTAPARG